MKIIKILIFLILVIVSSLVKGQTAMVRKLGEIYESDTKFIVIEPNSRLSYIEDKSIFTSYDEGKSWQETKTPFMLLESAGTIYMTTYKALANGDYILHTSQSLYYLEDDEWKILSINGDSIFNRGFYVDDNNVYFFNDNNLFVFDGNTRVVDKVKSVVPFCCYELIIFKNHIVISVGSGRYEVYNKKFDLITTLNYVPLITEAGAFVRKNVIKNSENKYGNVVEISKDNGLTYTVLYKNELEEYDLIGDIDNRLYFRGLISQPEAWSYGHKQARLGYFDLNTGEKIQVYDGSSQKNNNTPLIVNKNLVHNINGAIIKYPNGNFSQREVLFKVSVKPTKIKKIRVVPDGTYYALTRNFLYISKDSGNTWLRLLDNHTVVDFDINEKQELYCISNDQILKSFDKGISFSKLATIYPKGIIDYPYEIICGKEENLIIKGIGHLILGTGSVGCFDCVKSYPDFVFVSLNDGLSWEEKYVYHGGYPNISAAQFYNYPSNIAVQSYYHTTIADKMLFVDNYQFSIIDRNNYDQKNVSLLDDEWYKNKFGLTKQGHIIKNTEGNVSYSKDGGLTYKNLSFSNPGRVYAGFSPQSVFIISDDQSTKGSLSYQANYNTPFKPLEVRLKDSDQGVLDSFDMIYTDGNSNFLFLENSCYRIETIHLNSSVFNYDNKRQKYEVYPNPVTEILNINYQNNISLNTKVKIFDNILNLITSFEFESDNIEFDTKELTPGIYYIVFNNIQGTFCSKFLKI